MDELLYQHSPSWNETADLAILLEPLFWPAIVGLMTRSAFTDEVAFGRAMSDYRERVLGLVAGLDIEHWKAAHESLRIEGARADKNADLYFVLLRLSDWNRRKQLKGVVSLALWLRHIGEVLRRGFEEVHSVGWPEEDQAFGYWLPGGRRQFLRVRETP